MLRILDDAEDEVWFEIERRVEAFEKARATRGHADPAEFCPPGPGALRLAVAAELVRVDLELSSRNGSPKSLEHYREAFPDLFRDQSALACVAFEEYRLRKLSGESVTPDEYRERYGVDPSRWPAEAPPTLHSNPNSNPDTGQPPRATNEIKLESGAFPRSMDEVAGFRLLELLGRGAFGRVFLAEQADLAGRRVALKITSRRIQEAGTLARLQHTNIAPVYSVHPLGKLQAICMPYLGRATLADAIRAIRQAPEQPRTGALLAKVAAGLENPGEPPRYSEPLTRLADQTHVDACLRIAADIADGLAHAHDRGIAHRDLKPANVLLSDDGRPLLLDFNLASDAAQPRHDRLVGGTPSHMAPEQIEAHLDGRADGADDHRCDLYALGLILFELLTGRPAHNLPQGRAPRDLRQIRQARLAPPPPARRSNPQVTPAVDAILRKALHPDPAQRYPDARAFRQDLLRQLENRPLRHARETSIRESARKFLRRHPALRSLPFGIALLALAAAIGGTLHARRGRELDRAQADARLGAFREIAERARVRLSSPNPEPHEIRRALADGREALALYGLADGPDPDWRETRAFRHRNPDERAALRVDIGEIAYLMAEAEAANPQRLPQALRHHDTAALLLASDPSRAPHVAAQRLRLSNNSGNSGNSGNTDNPSESPDARHDPSSPAAVWLRVADLDRAGLHRKALEALLSVQPERGGSWVYWRAVADHRAAVGDWPGADAAYTTALAVAPRADADLLARRAAARLMLKDHHGAAADAASAARLAPDDPRIARDRALALSALGELHAALAELDRAELLEPRHTRVCFIRERVLAAAGRPEQARHWRDEGLRREPGDAPSCVARGLARWNHGDPQAALADFQRALQFDPDSREAAQNLASLLSETLGQNARALQILDQLVRRHPEYVPALAGRAVLLARLGRPDDARAQARRVLELAEREPFIRYQMAGVHALNSRTRPEDRHEALRLLKSALRDGQGLQWANNDHDLDPIRDDPELARLLDAARTLADAKRGD